MIEESLNGTVKRLKGRVKWFDPVKGFGFVVADDEHPDILLHANVLRNFGQSSIADQAIVEIDTQQTERGYQAVKVYSVEPPTETITHPSSFMLPVDDVDTVNLLLEPARVKWFDVSKGFGFANTFGKADDVFIHIDVLRRSGLASLMPGEAIAVRVVSGERGLMAIEVCGWESVAHQR